MNEAKFSDLVGMSLIKITVVKAVDDEIVWETYDGRKFRMYHNQDCCERVDIEDITGDLDDLLNEPILKAEERISNGPIKDEWDDGATWTFYEIATIKGSVTIRWYGTSNGYYSERVDFEEIV